MNGSLNTGRLFAPTSTLQLSVACRQGDDYKIHSELATITLVFFITFPRNLKNREVFSKSDPLCIMYVKHGDKWHEVGRTEQVRSITFWIIENKI